MAKLLASWGIEPAAMIGHSAGEYVAACLSGVISMEDGLRLVSLRGRLFETVAEGAMLSVSLSEDAALAIMPEGLSIAAVNAPDLCVASGPVALIAELEARLGAADIDCARIHIDVAAHSSMLEPILAEFGAFCRTIRFSPPTVPYVSNLTGTWVTTADVTDPGYWVRHLRGAVRFSDGIAAILADPNRVLLEVGPGRTLASLARLNATTTVAVAPTHPSSQGGALGRRVRPRCNRRGVGGRRHPRCRRPVRRRGPPSRAPARRTRSSTAATGWSPTPSTRRHARRRAASCASATTWPTGSRRRPGVARSSATSSTSRGRRHGC